MPVSVHRSPTRRALPLGLSALAFVGLAYLEVVPAHADERAIPPGMSSLETQAVPGPEPARIVLADMRTEATAEKSAGTEIRLEQAATQAAMPPSMITIPSVVGMNLRAARSQLRAAGLKVTIRDQFNERIDRQDMRFYDVDRQSRAGGEQVKPGSWIRLTAEDNFPVAMGY